MSISDQPNPPIIYLELVQRLRAELEQALTEVADHLQAVYDERVQLDSGWHVTPDYFAGFGDAIEIVRSFEGVREGKPE